MFRDENTYLLPTKVVVMTIQKKGVRIIEVQSPYYTEKLGFIGLVIKFFKSFRNE